MTDNDVETIIAYGQISDRTKIPKDSEIIGKTFYVICDKTVIQFDGTKWNDIIKNRSRLTYIFVDERQLCYPLYIISNNKTYHNLKNQYAACDKCHCLMFTRELVANMQNSQQLLYCHHCFFSMFHDNVSIETNGMTIIDYILKYSRHHDKQTCKNPKTCFICDYKNGTLNPKIKNVHKLYENAINNLSDDKKINITI